MESVGGRLGVCELATCASIGIKNPSAKQVFIVRGTTEGRAQGVMSDIDSMTMSAPTPE
jgi:hypothetical protein